jgi:hypothetical protein
VLSFSPPAVQQVSRNRREVNSEHRKVEQAGRLQLPTQPPRHLVRAISLWVAFSVKPIPNATITGHDEDDERHQARLTQRTK